MRTRRRHHHGLAVPEETVLQRSKASASGLVPEVLHHAVPTRDVTEQTGVFGGLVIFAQVLDAITTLVGIDLLGFTEEVFLSRLIIESTAQLPFSDFLGSTWLFVVVKSVLVVGIVTMVARTDDATRGEQWLLLGITFVAGFGPALNNLGLQLQA